MTKNPGATDPWAEVNRFAGDQDFLVKATLKAAGREAESEEFLVRHRSRAGASYSYDGRLNLVGKMDGAGTGHGELTGYSYDPANRLTEVSLPNGDKRRYGYDVMGRRIWSESVVRTHGGGTTTTREYHIYDAGWETIADVEKKPDDSFYVKRLYIGPPHGDRFAVRHDGANGGGGVEEVPLCARPPGLGAGSS